MNKEEVVQEESCERMRILCAWCLVEQGIEPDPGESHGICIEHAERAYADYRARRAARLAKVA